LYASIRTWQNQPSSGKLLIKVLSVLAATVGKSLEIARNPGFFLENIKCLNIDTWIGSNNREDFTH
jgi:hypothetical protein